jgi:uncharacterized glyoxalase superfamily protein PhnB
MKNAMMVPCLSYKNAKEAIGWLCDTFGFQKHQVFEGENNLIVHAELTLHGSLVMVASAHSGTEWSKRIKLPAEIGGFETQSPYVILENVGELYDRAKRNGATMVVELKDEAFGGKSFTCFDPEGHLWSFGSYNPLEHHKEETRK